MIPLLASHWPACNSLCPACFHNPTHCFCSMRLGSLLYGLVGELLVLPEELLVLLGVLPDLVLPLLRRLGLLLFVEVDVLTSAFLLVSGLSDGGLYPEIDLLIIVPSCRGSVLFCYYLAPLFVTWPECGRAVVISMSRDNNRCRKIKVK
jgi:hypothetical protein